MSAFNTEEETQPQQPVPDLDELPVRQPDEFEDVPVPRRITRETDAESEPERGRQDTREGDEGIDDPAPETDQMGD